MDIIIIIIIVILLLLIIIIKTRRPVHGAVFEIVRVPIRPYSF